MNTRASANRPTSAIASAARANGRSVASDGTIAAAQHHRAEDDVGRRCGTAATRSRATTASLLNSLRIVRYGCSSDGALRFCSHARHWLTQPTSSGASSSAIASCSSCEQEAGGGHRTKQQQREQRDEAVDQIDRRCGPAGSGPRSRARQLGAARRSAGTASARSGRSSVDAVARRRVEWRRQLRARSGRTASKICRIGWPKPSAVSCMRGVCSGKPQSHGGAAAHAPVIEAMHDLHRQQHDARRSPAARSAGCSSSGPALIGASSSQFAAIVRRRRSSRSASR